MYCKMLKHKTGGAEVCYVVCENDRRLIKAIDSLMERVMVLFLTFEVSGYRVYGNCLH